MLSLVVLANVLRHTNWSKTGLRGRVGEGKALEGGLETFGKYTSQHGLIAWTNPAHKELLPTSSPYWLGKFSRTRFNVLKTEICKYKGLFASLGFGKILLSLWLCQNKVYYLWLCLLFIM